MATYFHRNEDTTSPTDRLKRLRPDGTVDYWDSRHGSTTWRPSAYKACELTAPKFSPIKRDAARKIYPKAFRKA